MILLLNMVSAEQADANLGKEVGEECVKFGKVLQVEVHEHSHPHFLRNARHHPHFHLQHLPEFHAYFPHLFTQIFI